MKVTIDKNELYLDPEIFVKCKEIDDILQDIIASRSLTNQGAKSL